MKTTLLLILLLMAVPPASADTMSCNVGGKALFTLIELDTASKQVVMTDTFGKETKGKITSVRAAGSGKNRFNVAFEYRLNDTPTFFDMIIVPVSEEGYSVGMAGYIRQGRNKVLEATSKDEAMCF